MNKIKRTLLGLVLVVPVLYFFTGCKKFLDRKPLEATLDDLTGGGLEGQAIGLYGALRNSASEPYVGDGFQSIPWLGMQSFRSDDQEIVADAGAAGWHQTYDFFNYTKDDWGAGVYWDKHYVFIGLCNSLLQLADSLQLTDEASLINVAEGRWMRAFAYFDLVRNFGEVPKIDFKIYNPSDAQVAKSSVADIYALIDADLTYAEQYLPDSWLDPKFIGRLTKGSAKTLHAKSLIYQKQYAQSLALCEDIINSNQYQLFVPYALLWKTANENSSESIFEIQAYQSAGRAIDYWSWFGTSQGVRGSDADGWNLGWGWNTPTQKLVDAYEPGDPRKQGTILFSGKPDGTSEEGGYGRDVPPYTNAKYWNKKVYVDPAEQAVTGDIHGAGFVNYRALRYADVILMAAEAANELGQGELAAQYLEMIRARARNGNDAVLPKVDFVDQMQMRKAIQHERRIEFAMEQERFYDLVRWGAADTVLAPLGYQPKHKYFPIPQNAITASGGKLLQNPDY
ncbi:MAG: RagB/SusD family nutrient uptake outer membrane protein [Chitinophagaceae bacterium]|nr:RagB/SusD family nutrient uptake outer membrane protein [Chitinophagaceae bacterium]